MGRAANGAVDAGARMGGRRGASACTVRRAIVPTRTWPMRRQRRYGRCWRSLACSRGCRGEHHRPPRVRPASSEQVLLRWADADARVRSERRQRACGRGAPTVAATRLAMRAVRHAVDRLCVVRAFRGGGLVIAPIVERLCVAYLLGHTVVGVYLRPSVGSQVAACAALVALLAPYFAD